MGKVRSVKDFCGNEWNVECIGCAIANGDMQIPGGVIYDGKGVVLGADPEIPIPGFLIVTAKRHINSLSECTKEEREEITEVLCAAENAIKELGIAEKITIVQEETSSHFHIWIFPWHDWMIEKFGKDISYLRDIAKYAKENASEEERNNVIETVELVKKYLTGRSIL